MNSVFQCEKEGVYSLVFFIQEVILVFDVRVRRFQVIYLFYCIERDKVQYRRRRIFFKIRIQKNEYNQLGMIRYWKEKFLRLICLKVEVFFFQGLFLMIFLSRRLDFLVCRFNFYFFFILKFIFFYGVFRVNYFF